MTMNMRIMVMSVMTIVAAGCAATKSEKSVAGGRPSGTAFVSTALMPFVEKGELPGAISILYKDGFEEVACVGYADVAEKRRVTLDDPFMQCSQTKGFCGVTIAKLVEEGKISLDDPVHKYLPEFKDVWYIDSDDNKNTRVLKKSPVDITVRMVMNHTAGFEFELPGKRDNIPGGGWSGGMPIRIIAAEAAGRPLSFLPGSKVAYSNTGIDVGAAVVEAVTGMKWEEYLKRTVLEPLDMKETSFKPTDEQLARQIEMYECVKDKPASYRRQNGWQQRPYNGDHVFPSAGAGIWTTARDQVKFYKMLMNLGVGDNGVRVLKEETVKNLLAVSSRGAGREGYSLGLSAPVEDGVESWFGHGGAWGTCCMVNWHKKELNLWVVQLTGGPRPWDQTRNEAANAFFNAAIDTSAADAYTGRTK